MTRKKTSFTHSFVTGMLTGATNAAIFNPLDRALYLSVVNHNKLFCIDNWKHPYSGFLSSWVHRTLSSGLYFILQDQAQQLVFTRELHSDTTASLTCYENFSIGLVAGSLNGLILNPLSVVRYQCWSDRSLTFWSEVAHIVREAPLTFLKGSNMMIAREITFGCTYEIGRHILLHCMVGSTPEDFKPTNKNIIPEEHIAAADQNSLSPLSSSSFAVTKEGGRTKRNKRLVIAEVLSNVMAAAVGTLLSSPLNYVRNIKFSYRAHQTPPTAIHCLTELHYGAVAFSRQQITNGSDLTFSTSVENLRAGRRDRGLVRGEGAMKSLGTLSARGFWWYLVYVQERVKVGWGTARVAVGMALGQFLYPHIKEMTQFVTK